MGMGMGEMDLIARSRPGTSKYTPVRCAQSGVACTLGGEGRSKQMAAVTPALVGG